MRSDKRQIGAALYFYDYGKPEYKISTGRQQRYSQQRKSSETFMVLFTKW